MHGFIRGLTASDASVDVAALTGVSVLLRAAAATIFVVACGNVAAFLLARASGRSQEMAVRVALGASRRHLTSHVLADTVVVAVGGGVLGMVFAVWMGNVIPALFFESDAEHLVFSFGASDIGLTVVACVALTIVCGLVPLMEVGRHEPARVLQRESLGPSSAARRLRAGLVIVQMGCCCTLVISAYLLRAGFQATLQTGLGRRVGDAVLATAQVQDATTPAEYATNALDYFNEIARAVQTVPGVAATAWIARPPGSWPSLMSVRVEPPDVLLRDVVLDVRVFTSRSLDEITVPPLAGRIFGGGDTSESCKVVIVNEAAAEALFGASTVGRSIEDAAGERLEIVGVVATHGQTDLGTAVRPTVYYYGQQTMPPLGKVGPSPFRVPDEAPARRATVDANTVSAAYFDVSRIRLTEGERFSLPPPGGRCRTGVVDQRAAEELFGGHALGGAVVDEAGRRTTIVGVIESTQLRSWQRPPHPAVYFLLEQNVLPRMTLFVRTSGPADDILRNVEREVAAVPGGKDDVRVTTLHTHLSRNVFAPERIASTLVGVAAAIALVLGVLGAYAVLAESARQRRRDFALCLALGAPRLVVLRQMLVQALRLAAAGAAGGLFIALFVRSWILRAVSDAGAMTAWTWLSGPLALLALASFASLIPALRVLSSEPLTTLREK